LFKEGDRQDPANYRPVSILPILYKLFSRIVHGRVKECLGKAQSEDQAGIRPGFCCEDHLFTFTQLQEKCDEWGLELWLVAVDFEKAFDTIEHEAIWQALASQGVPNKVIQVFKHLYGGQQGTVGGDRVSRKFAIGRGSRQGDPISPALFNAVLEEVFRKLKTKWREEGKGLTVGQRRG